MSESAFRAVRQCALITVPSSNHDRATYVKSLSSGHIPFMHIEESFTSKGKEGLLPFNLSEETMHYYVSLSGARHFLFCQFDCKGDMTCKRWELQDYGQTYHCKRNPFVCKEQQELDIYDQIHLYVEAANEIIMRNLDSMAKALHQSKEEIFDLANSGVGIAPWYYRQVLYKGLFDKNAL